METGNKKIGQTMQKLSSESYKEREEALQQIITYGNDAVDNLIEGLMNINGNFREWSAKGLGVIGNKRAIPALKALYHRDNNYEVRSQALKALGLLGDYDSLFEGMRDRDEHVRLDSAGYLGDLSLDELIPKLLDGLTNTSEKENYRVAIANSLAKYKPNALLYDKAVSLLNNKDFLVRLACIGILSEQKDKTAIPLMAGLLKDENYKVRLQVVSSLGKLNGPEAIDPLISALDDCVYTVRREAVCQLANIGGNIAIEALKKQESRENEEHVKQWIREKISKAERQGQTSVKSKSQIKEDIKLVEKKKGWKFWK